MQNTKNIIHTTGALLQPQKVTDSSGNTVWMWIVVEFTDDCYKDDEIFNPSETATNLEELLIDRMTDYM